MTPEFNKWWDGDDQTPTKMMREFDLESAKRGEPIVCRDGTPAKFIAHVPEAHPTQKIVVLLGDNIYGYFESGQRTGIKNDRADLFMDTKKQTVWVNFYPDGTAEWFASEFEALNCGRSLLTNGRAWPVEIEK
jgi:hypothetical protein